MKLVLSLLVITSIFGMGFLCCTNEDAEKPIKPAVIVTTPVSYGNGIYYLPANRQEFGIALVAFRKSHPELHIEAMSGDGTAGYGADRGYWIVCDSIQK